MWIDSHCHLTTDRFDVDRSAVLERAALAGVDTLIAIGSGYGVRSNADAVALAAASDGIYATAGVHPHEAAELDDELRLALRAWLAAEEVVAVGECGLDYHYMNSPHQVQRSVFAEQLVLAREFDLPVSLHVRGDDPNAYDEVLDIWQAEGGASLEGVLHCYTGTRDFARRALDAGFYISFSGIVTFKRSEELREAAKLVPLDRLLVETDAPFLAPEGHRGQRNEPAWVPIVGEQLARIHGVEAAAMAEHTRTNTRRLFRLSGKKALPVPVADQAGAEAEPGTA